MRGAAQLAGIELRVAMDPHNAVARHALTCEFPCARHALAYLRRCLDRRIIRRKLVKAEGGKLDLDIDAVEQRTADL